MPGREPPRHARYDEGVVGVLGVLVLLLWLLPVSLLDVSPLDVLLLDVLLLSDLPASVVLLLPDDFSPDLSPLLSAAGVLFFLA